MTRPPAMPVTWEVVMLTAARVKPHVWRERRYMLADSLAEAEQEARAGLPDTPWLIYERRPVLTSAD